MGSSQGPGSRKLVNITISILMSLLCTLESGPQTWGQLSHLESHRDGRGSFILSFIQPAYPVPGADSAMEHTGLMRTDTVLFLMELTSCGALRPLSTSLPHRQTSDKTVV